MSFKYKNEIAKYTDTPEYLIKVRKYINALKDKKLFERIYEIYFFNPERLLDFIFLEPEHFTEFYNFALECKKGSKCCSFYGKNKVLLDDLFPYLFLDNSNIGSYALRWILLPNLKKVLIKKLPEEFYILDEFKERKASSYNILIVPEIAKQFEIACAEYFLAGSDVNSRLCITPSFLEEGEEVIQGDYIKTLGGNSRISNYANDIVKYLRARNVDEDTIHKVEFDFIKQSFFKKFIFHVDDAPRNWGIIKGKDGGIRLTPTFDIDHTCKVYEEIWLSEADNGDTSLEAFMLQYQNYPGFKAFVKKCMDNFDIDNAFLNVEHKHGIKMSNEDRSIYANFFRTQMEIVKSTYEKMSMCYGEDDELY